MYCYSCVAYHNYAFSLASVDGEDYFIGTVSFAIGPCNPCAPSQLSASSKLTVRDDDDLEFDHGITVGLEATNPLGILVPDPVTVTFTDDGTYVCILSLHTALAHFHAFITKVIVHMCVCVHLYIFHTVLITVYCHRAVHRGCDL